MSSAPPMTKSQLEEEKIRLRERLRILKTMPGVQESEILATRAAINSVSDALASFSGGSLASGGVALSSSAVSAAQPAPSDLDLLEMSLSSLSVQDDPILISSDHIEKILPLIAIGHKKPNVLVKEDKISDTINLKQIVTEYRHKPSIEELYDLSLLFTDINVTLNIDKIKSKSDIYFNFLLADGRRVTVSLHSKESKDKAGALHMYIKYTTEPNGPVHEPKRYTCTISVEHDVSERKYIFKLNPKTSLPSDIVALYQTILDFVGTYLTLVIIEKVTEFLGKKGRKSYRNAKKSRKSYRKAKKSIKSYRK